MDTDEGMDTQLIGPLVWLVVMVAVVVAVMAATRKGRGGRSYGPGMIGATYDLLNEEKRRATELIVEEKAEARRPEYPDGNLPDLDDPKGAAPKR